MEELLRVDFHCHSIYSPDSMGNPLKLISEAHRKGIDRLAVTDHNTIQGALLARELDPELIIVGEEIRTNRGELLAIFMQEEIPSGLPYLEVIERLKKQDAFICIPHPFDRNRSRWSREEMVALVPLVDAIEVFNSRCILSGFNKAALDFAKEYNLPGIAGSDAHNPIEIGQAFIKIPQFSNTTELRKVVCKGNIIGKKSPLWYHLFSLYASIYKSLFSQF